MWCEVLSRSPITTVYHLMVLLFRKIRRGVVSVGAISSTQFVFPTLTTVVLFQQLKHWSSPYLIVNMAHFFKELIITCVFLSTAEATSDIPPLLCSHLLVSRFWKVSTG